MLTRGYNTAGSTIDSTAIHCACWDKEEFCSLPLKSLAFCVDRQICESPLPSGLKITPKVCRAHVGGIFCMILYDADTWS